MRIAKALGMVLVLVLAAQGAFAFTTITGEQTSDEASITISGTVAEVVAISLEGVGDFDDLNLLDNVTDETIVSVTEFSNVASGYTVTVDSQNGLEFQGGSVDEETTNNGNETLEYTLQYGGESVSDGQQFDRSEITGTAGTTRDMTISYNGQDVNLPGGDYEDTLTFTIEAK
ncbi:MAG: hypothetical protein ACLFM0_05690 [Spirochaetales bacterium]